MILFTVLFLAGSISCVFSENAHAKDNNDDLKAGFSWSPEYPSAEQMITFDASPTTSSAPIVEYAWDFEDDGEDDAWIEKVEWAYSKPDIYTVELWVKDANGNTDHARENIS